MSTGNQSLLPACIGNNIPVLLISLEDQNQRRADLVQRSVPKSWVHNFFPAIDMRGVTAGSYESFADTVTMETKLRRPVRPAEIGCALSHQAAAKWLAQSNYDLALIIEDDIVPQTDIWEAQTLATARALMAHARRGAAFICHLGARHDQADPALKRRVIFDGGQPDPCMPKLLLHSDPDRTLWRAHAYLISRAVAERVWTNETRIITLADDWGERRQRGWIDEVFFTRPILIGQNEAIPSTIRPPNHDDYYKPPPYEGRFWTRVYNAISTGTFARRVRQSVNYRASMAAARLRSKIPYVVNLVK